MKFMILAILAALVLTGCGTLNSGTAAVLNNAGQDYMGAKANIQQTDDFKLRAWLDSACAINIGALQRAISTSGNPSIANAIFTACPVPAVGVTSTSATGSMQVQTFNLPPLVRDSTGAISNSVPQPQAAPTTAPTVAPVSTAPVVSAPVVKKAIAKPVAPVQTPAPMAPTPITTPAVAVPAQPVTPSILPGGLPGQ